MFDHVTIRVSDRESSEAFYETVLRTLGVERTYTGEDLVEWQDFSIAPADGRHPVTRNLHAGFVAPSREHADAFWRAGLGAGARDDGAPNPRPEYGEDYYGAFLLDPDGNSAEAVHHSRLRRGGNDDHLWIRVADVAAAKAFYAIVDAFHRTAVEAGYRDNGAPGERPEYHPGYYGAFVLDPDGNNVEVVSHNR